MGSLPAQNIIFRGLTLISYFSRWWVPKGKGILASDFTYVSQQGEL